jgi:group II intron reverse transcriptase/maturase
MAPGSTKRSKPNATAGLPARQGGAKADATTGAALPAVARGAEPCGAAPHGAEQPFSQVCSVENLTRAWRKVKTNGGAAGVDNVTVQDFERDLAGNLERLRRDLVSGRYQPQLVRRVWIPKSSGGRRPLAILAVRDRIAQRLAYDALAPAYERGFLDCSYGFREGRSRQDAADAVARRRDEGLRWVVDGDIRECFDTLDHDVLLAILGRGVSDPAMMDLIRKWLKARVMHDLESQPRAAGVFQGGAISPLLCNIYLHPFDLVMTRLGLALVRYADDWVVLCAKKSDAEAALQAAAETLARLRLAINPYKTRIVHFDQGFAFLGTFFVRSKRYDLSPQANVADLLMLQE